MVVTARAARDGKEVWRLDLAPAGEVTKVVEGPDVAAKRAVAVLFDEHEDIRTSMIHSNNGLAFEFDGAYSGGRCFRSRGDRKAHPLWQPPFGHVIPNWDFEIAEDPSPGQYRWLRFAWKGVSAGTRGITLKVSGPQGGVVLCAGEAMRFSDADPAPVKLCDSPPPDWRVESVDLWELLKKPARIRSLSLGATGGGGLFDQILLGRSPRDLQLSRPARK